MGVLLEDAAGAAGGYTIVRRRFVDRLRAAGIRDARILEAFGAVPRHAFVPEALMHRAYEEIPLLIGDGQTISAPGIVAAMTQALRLKGGENVLEIGTGSGYQAAILSRLVGRVVSIERIPRLAARARSSLDALGVSNVIVYFGDGTQGRPDQAPYDRVVVTAGGPEIPKPLLEQLAPGGCLVGPFGERGRQHLVRVHRADEKSYTREVLGKCDFVDLIGRNGWAA